MQTDIKCLSLLWYGGFKSGKKIGSILAWQNLNQYEKRVILENHEIRLLTSRVNGLDIFPSYIFQLSEECKEV